MLSLKRAKHVHHRYSLIKDLIDHGEIEIPYAPMGEMWYDVLTKPTSGTGFKDMREVLINLPANYDDIGEAKKMHPDLLLTIEKADAKFGKGLAVRRKGFGSNVFLTPKQVRTSNKKKISQRSLLVQYRSVLGID